MSRPWIGVWDLFKSASSAVMKDKSLSTLIFNTNVHPSAKPKPNPNEGHGVSINAKGSPKLIDCRVINNLQSGILTLTLTLIR